MTGHHHGYADTAPQLHSGITIGKSKMAIDHIRPPVSIICFKAMARAPRHGNALQPGRCTRHRDVARISDADIAFHRALAFNTGPFLPVFFSGQPVWIIRRGHHHADIGMDSQRLGALHAKGAKRRKRAAGKKAGQHEYLQALHCCLCLQTEFTACVWCPDAPPNKAA